MRTLLIDNYDSFTYNLFHLLAEVNGVEPIVLMNDDERGYAGLDFSSVDAIVISPGPGRPDREPDFGLSRLALERTRTPLLGVCLGHQGLCHFAGARIVRAPEPFHGRLSPVLHDQTGLFQGIPSPFVAVRYHSLVATDLPKELEALAHTPEGVLMAARHRERPHFGVQFHPESIAAEHGRRLFENFHLLARAPGVTSSIRQSRSPPERRQSSTAGAAGLALSHEPLLTAPLPERAVSALFGESRWLAWLDSSLVVDGTSRFSMVCAPGEDLGEVVSYDATERSLVVRRVSDDRVTRSALTLFEYLERELELRALPSSDLPSGFSLGYVGTLGYELSADDGAAKRCRSEHSDACLLFCDRGYLYDHLTERGWLLALHRSGMDEAARTWLDRARQSLTGLGPEPEARAAQPWVVGTLPHSYLHGRARYRELIDCCQQELESGEAYELCLTNRIRVPFTADPLLTYRILRRENPAPYAAFLRLPGLCVLSSSPERFLRIDRCGNAESRPIKGTARRALDPTEDQALARELASSEKQRSENLMIVDLVRNDLGRVCQVGSVHVPELFAVESYRTVHQLVSTVRGRLSPESSVVACVKACFPGGSMTGAPKLRAMEILERLEGSARGVYSGALGYFSLDGSVDLSIVIRTIVLAKGEATVGVGGAIVALSDPRAELDEVELKAEALLRVLSLAAAEAGSVGEGKADSALIGVAQPFAATLLANFSRASMPLGTSA